MVGVCRGASGHILSQEAGERGGGGWEGGARLALSRIILINPFKATLLVIQGLSIKPDLFKFPPPLDATV